MFWRIFFIFEKYRNIAACKDVNHGLEKVRIRSYSGPHFLRIFGLNTYLSVFSPNAGKSGKNADQNNSECGLFLRSKYNQIVLNVSTSWGISTAIAKSEMGLFVNKS